MRLHAEVLAEMEGQEEEGAAMASTVLSPPLVGAAVAAATAPRLVVGYALTKKKVKSFLQRSSPRCSCWRGKNLDHGQGEGMCWRFEIATGCGVVMDFEGNERFLVSICCPRGKEFSDCFVCPFN